MNKSWTAFLEEDPNDPESLILPLPQDLLEEAGWTEGDTLVWTVESDRIILSKKQ